MKRLIFLLEEPSAKEMLQGMLPAILPNYVFAEYKTHSDYMRLTCNIFFTIICRPFVADDIFT